MRPSELAGLALTYSPVGRTQHGPPPDGFHHLAVTRRLGAGDAAYRAAAEAVMTFGAQRGTGLRPRATAPRAAEGVERLICRYLQGFGPAAAADIANWAGLPGAVVDAALERLELRRFRDESGGPLVDRPIASPVATPALPVIDATVAPVGTMRLTEDERLLLREQLRRLPRRAPADH